MYIAFYKNLHSKIFLKRVSEEVGSVPVTMLSSTVTPPVLLRSPNGVEILKHRIEAVKPI